MPTRFIELGNLELAIIISKPKYGKKQIILENQAYKLIKRESVDKQEVKYSIEDMDNKEVTSLTGVYRSPTRFRIRKVRRLKEIRVLHYPDLWKAVESDLKSAGVKEVYVWSYIRLIPIVRRLGFKFRDKETKRKYEGLRKNKLLKYLPLYALPLEKRLNK